jgi:hypothetical protein
MTRIKNIGNGFISLDGDPINLKEFKEIKKEQLGLFDADNDEYYAIAFTPSQTKPEDHENGVDGTWHVTYQDENLRDKDFEEIEKCLSN